MPFTFNGIGTALSGKCAPIHWTKPSLFGLAGQRPDHDAIECFVLFFFPLIPYRPVHTFGWSGNRYRTVPLRHTGAMLVNVYLRPIAFALAIGGLFAVWVNATPILTAADPLSALSRGVAISVAVAVIGFATLRLLPARYRRTRDIRLVMGPHELGSSDPVLWSPEILEKAKPVEVADVHAAVDAGQYGLAMLRARIAIAQGLAEGEQLTDQILTHPVVQAALPALRREPWRRAELLQR